MKKIRTKNFITCALITVFVLSLFAIGFATFIQKETRVYEEFKKQELDIFSKYTFERSMEIDGEKVSFKESGDEKFRYYHDENGNVLIREDDSLTYATLNDDGKVVSTGVSVTSTETKTETITVGDINLSLNPGFLGKEDRASTNGGLVTTYGDNNEEITEEVSQQPLLAGSTGKRTIVNFVILIKFNDTTDTVVNNAISSFDTYFNGVNNSLRNYYEVIINPNEWETVQAELKKRKTVGSTNNYINAFLGRVVCADCGTSYGPKIWHSTSKYRREVYQCNAKFKNKCKTPTLTEDEMKGLFLKAYSQFMGNKAQVIEDTEEMIQTLCDTTKLQKDIETLTTKAEDIVVLAENLITRNATQAMNPDEFESRYESYDNEHNQLIEKITKKQNQIKERKSKAICLKAFIKELRERETILNEFDEMVWSYLIEKATVNRDGSVSFLFRNGVEVRV